MDDSPVDGAFMLVECVRVLLSGHQDLLYQSIAASRVQPSSDTEYVQTYKILYSMPCGRSSLIISLQKPSAQGSSNYGLASGSISKELGSRITNEFTPPTDPLPITGPAAHVQFSASNVNCSDGPSHEVPQS